MDREALIARLYNMDSRILQWGDLSLNDDERATAKAFKDAADALASDAKLLEELKARCDREDEAVYAGGALRIPALTTDEIRALFGWDATTKDLHTETTKGDT